MGKHKKTRQEKMIADLRRKLSLQTTSPSTIPHLTLKLPTIPTPSQTSLIYSHDYLKSDLLKTTFITCSIIVAEIILFVLIKQQIIKLL